MQTIGLRLEVSHAVPRRRAQVEHRCEICGELTPRAKAWPKAVPAACGPCLELLTLTEAEALRMRQNGTSAIGPLGEERYMRWIALALLSERDLDRAMRSWPEDVRALKDIRSGETQRRVLSIRGLARMRNA